MLFFVSSQFILSRRMLIQNDVTQTTLKSTGIGRGVDRGASLCV